MKTKICIVTADFYPKISSLLLFGCKKELLKSRKRDTIHVPGIFEIQIVIAKELDAYDDFIAPLIKSVQELSAEVTELKAQLKTT